VATGYRRENIAGQSYKYNGKELQDELGLGWLDYGARMYDPALGRFMVQDAFAEKYLAMTPYQYAANNPIKYIDVNGDSTYLVVYGSGHLNPNMQGQSNDVGDGFKKNAEARAKELRKNLQEGDEVVVVNAATEDEYINALNTEYSSGVIKQLDVYSHGTNNSINLGGPESGAPTETGPGDADYRLVSAFPSQQNPDGNNEIARIDANNFSTSSTVNLWGCNLGGANTAAITSGANHAQYMANHLGGSATVNAFNGGGGAEFKQNGGAIKYDGTMIRSADRGSQRVTQTAYKPR
jgi:RHS repeat-associated protein